MKWNLEYHFKTQEDYENACQEVMKLIRELGSYQGKLSVEEDFVNYFITQQKLNKVAERVYQYSALRSDLNKKDVNNKAELDKVMMAFYQLAEVVSFEGPEILSIGEEEVLAFLDRNPEIEEFRFGIKKLFRSKEHILDYKNEKLLSLFSNLSEQGGSLYSSLAVGDGVPVKIFLENGEEVTVTQGNYRSLIENSTSARDRKNIFEAVFKTFSEHKNTYASIYETTMSAELANSKARNYSSILESHLFNNNIPTEVFYNLIDIASNNNASLKKYIKLITKYLKLDKFHTYDRFLNLATSSKKYTYEEAKELFFESIKGYPKEFVDKAHEVLQDGFVDVYENDGKATGAYSSSVTDLHPFILLNFDGTLDSVFTLAHEAGHSMHSMFSAENQKGVMQSYTIFVAEIASTFNEHVLLDYFINSGKATKEEKIMMLQKAIMEIFGTFYRQTLFAEYEDIAHKMIENNEPVNHEIFSNIMISLYKKYYDIDISEEPYKQYVWAYIPHLYYTPFYVYQYATSFAASFKLYKNVKEHGESAMNKYIGLLSSGGSKYPVEQAKEAGVDFTDKSTFTAVVERLDELVEELEKVINE